MCRATQRSYILALGAALYHGGDGLRPVSLALAGVPPSSIASFTTSQQYARSP
jgi:hypothetical protein